MAYTADMDDFGTNGQGGAEGWVPPEADRYEALVAGPDGAPDWTLLGKVRDGGFSWCTFFLGPLYWAYRKCYAEAAVLVAFNVLAGFLPESFLWALLSLVTCVVLGFAFPYLYRWRADRLHAKAFAQGAASEREAVAYVRAHGGTSWVGVVALLAVAVALACAEVALTGLVASPAAAPRVSAF